MKHRFLPSIVTSICLVAGALAGTRPHYGGTLHVQSRDNVTTLDDVWVNPNSVLRQQLARMLYDRLTEVDDAGNVRPSLAISWRADAGNTWEFHLRENVYFPDGQLLSGQTAAAALSKAAPQWKTSVREQLTLVIETDIPIARLPELLSLPEYSITKLDMEQKIVGSGPFLIDTFQPARRIVLTANDDYWGGRAYLDKVDITMNGSLREELINRRLDEDDVAELNLDQARTIGYGSPNSQRLLATQHTDLYALVFFRAPAPGPVTPAGAPRVDEPRVRDAINLTIDRAAISRVLLQKQAESAPSLLPQWMTGYSFLFPAETDVDRARKLLLDAFKAAPVSIFLSYASNDNVARSVAERIAVNAREANISIQTIAEKNLTLETAKNTGSAVVLLRMPLASSSTIAALADLELRAGSVSAVISSTLSATTAESLYSAEKAALEGSRMIPIAFVPQIFWLHSRVHDWATPANGGWRLQDVWVDNERPSAVISAAFR